MKVWLRPAPSGRRDGIPSVGVDAPQKRHPLAFAMGARGVAHFAHQHEHPPDPEHARGA